MVLRMLSPLHSEAQDQQHYRQREIKLVCTIIVKADGEKQRLLPPGRKRLCLSCTVFVSNTEGPRFKPKLHLEVGLEKLPCLLGNSVVTVLSLVSLTQ